MSRLALLAFAVAVFGCKEPPKDAPAAPATAAPAPSPAPTTSAAPSAAVAAAASPSGSAAPSHSPHCEVEIFGKVTGIPKDLPKDSEVVVFVAQNDCLADDAQILGHTEVGSDGNLVIEVFPKWGTDVTICAAVVPGAGKPSGAGEANAPSTRYGKAKGTFHAEAEGEVTFNDVTVELKPGKPHVFPKDASDVPPSKMPSSMASAAASGAASVAPSAKPAPAAKKP